MTAQEIKTACFVCCPMCDEKKCVGRFNCEEIKRFMEKNVDYENRQVQQNA